MDLGHNPASHSKMSDVMLTLTRTGLRWSVQKERPLLGRERLGAMGIVLQSLLPPSCHKELAPQLELCKHFAHMPETQCLTFTGNGMHIPTAGAIIVWVLSHTVPRFGGPKGVIVIGFRDDDADEDRYCRWLGFSSPANKFQQNI